MHIDVDRDSVKEHRQQIIKKMKLEALRTLDVLKQIGAQALSPSDLVDRLMPMASSLDELERVAALQALWFVASA